MVELSKAPRPLTMDDVSNVQLVPAFMLSELRAAFQFGFVVFLPFLLIDLIVSSVLMALGMMMMPPVDDRAAAETPDVHPGRWLEPDPQGAGGLVPLTRCARRDSPERTNPRRRPSSTSARSGCAGGDAKDVSARETLVARHLPYARTVAATYYARRMHDEIEFGDYLQYARIGLLESVDRFDPAIGVQFRTYAARRMHGAILDGLERLTEKQQQIAVRQRLRRERLGSVKEKVAAPSASGSMAPDGGDGLFRYLADIGIGLAICHLLEGTGMVDNPDALDDLPRDRHYEPVEMAQLQRRLHSFVEQLGAQQRTVIRYHYLQEHSFEDIACLMSVTRGRVSQIHRQALSTLRTHLAAERACDVSW